jgi:hypothetical protein
MHIFSPLITSLTVGVRIFASYSFVRSGTSGLRAILGVDGGELLSTNRNGDCSKLVARYDSTCCTPFCLVLIPSTGGLTSHLIACDKKSIDGRSEGDFVQHALQSI